MTKEKESKLAEAAQGSRVRVGRRLLLLPRIDPQGEQGNQLRQRRTMGTVPSEVSNSRGGGAKLVQINQLFTVWVKKFGVETFTSRDPKYSALDGKV